MTAKNPDNVGGLPEPKFGDWIRGNFASEENPQRDGMYVRTIRRTGFTNPGKWYELTDGKGKFWQYLASETTRLCRAAPAGGDDLYRQACDSVEEWKARALEAEADIARIHAQINAENGPTFMGEPVVSAPAGFSRNEKIEAIAKWLIAAAERGDRREVEESIYRIRNALSESAPASKAAPIAYSGDLPGHKVMPGFITPERTAMLHQAIGHPVDSTTAGSGEVSAWNDAFNGRVQFPVPMEVLESLAEQFDEVYEREWTRAADAADDRQKAIMGPADRHATREAIAALLRKLQQGAE